MVIRYFTTIDIEHHFAKLAPKNVLLSIDSSIYYAHFKLLLHDALSNQATLFSMSMDNVGSNPHLANNWRHLGDPKLR